MARAEMGDEIIVLDGSGYDERDKTEDQEREGVVWN